ncbi:hypothetical protein GCM10011371_00910 [Novosphingobium marinum]|uniref:Sugar phosphate isomerase/epimerase n=1 Tax=Novosphingobium marinum TaxID=1514948 RepID=A0A7Z0BT67_9SPHN|nr:sugar phosphate isomerase/epimerase [Novosphingobium marinum]NYH93783.1 sugar phosphate isomerase/epimerase [Novosphingobium marinum]GGC17253.1 hypothetical protein GCM10011371_00910 [Novosphingobium marinum]
MNPIGLASGVVPEFGPVETVEAARFGGFDLVGLWVEPADWTAETTRATRSALRETGLPVIDVEVLWLQPGSSIDDHKRVLDIGAELGAANALCVSSEPDLGRTADWFAELCRHGGANGLRVALEFGIFTEVKNLAMAKEVISRADHPAAAILIDPIHVDRSQTPIADIAALDRNLLPYAQFCDALAKRPDPGDFDAIIEDAVDLRQQCGDGAVDLNALLRALPEDVPLSIELRSKALRDTYPEAGPRAKAVADATRKWLESA